MSDLPDTSIWGQGLQKNQKLEPLLGKAKELEKKYDWLGAADFYEKAILAFLQSKRPCLKKV